MTLKMLVDRYNVLAGKAGMPVPLADFGMAPLETEETFSAFDEDYHVSRYLHFSKAGGRCYRINGEEVTHVVMDGGIAGLL